jgi:predicted transcriptional regulator
MAETEHSQKNVAYIRTHVDNIEQLSRFAIASNPKCKEFVENYLKEKKGAPQIYLALSDGPRNLDELKKITRQSRANISKICKHLFQQGLIIHINDPSNARSFKYSWGDLERMLGVSSIAKKLIR